MMSMSAINSISYYENLAQEDYYTDGGEPLGQWVGQGARDLNLGKQVESADYRKIFNGFGPDGTPLCENAGENHRHGWDLTFSAPKSVSILWARADETTRTNIQTIQQLAVEKAISFIEKHAAYTRRGKGGHIQECVTGLIAATFEHSTSRAQDPQLHTHCLIANIAPRQDGTWGTLESKHLFLWQMASGAIYRSVLANGLRELGFEVEPVEKQKHFEVKGVCQKVCEYFSRRAQAIRAQMNVMGVTKAASKIGDIIAINTRSYKRAVDRAALFLSWQADMDRLSFRATDINRIRQPEALLFPEALPLQYILDKLILTQAVIRLQDIYVAVATEAQFQYVSVLDIEDTVRELVADNELISLGIDSSNSQIFTTKAMLAIEQDMLKCADIMHANNHYKLDDHIILQAIFKQSQQQGFELSDEQIEAVFSVCQSGLDIIQGKAGAGKSTSMQAMRLAYESKGFRVRGATVARQAAQQLERDTGIQSTTLASLLNDLSKGTDKFKNTVILLDEAGQFATPDLMQLMQAVNKVEAKLVLVGEQQQMDAITHGGSLRYLSQRHGCARINTIRRQREPWARVAVNDLRSGNAKSALMTYRSKGLLHIQEDSQSSRASLVQHWQSYIEANPTKETMILAQRWRDVKPLNDLVRDVYQEQGKLGTENILTECVVSNQSLYFEFSKGERVRFTRNDYKRDFTNGDKGCVLEVIKLENDICFTVMLDSGRTVSFKQSDYCDEHGRLYMVQAYASTVYSSQGATVDGDTFVLYTSGMDKAASYVAGSRHRDNCHWFVNGQELDAQSGQRDTGEASTDEVRVKTLGYCMSINRHKSMAIEYLAEAQLSKQVEQAYENELASVV
ncbi:MobF family relaxase [Yersinia enterocolitica]|uniref:MobF family relaxase n=1 Tax=Yersinia ruckeri TaxID=29486 RepID=UPI0020BD5448|nr:MobF family relaxase [Yersinia ruckeri]MCW6538947.1 relaxase domain-containing protein [Yersinia ruckeri]UZY11158.1 relaxase domain-containing protein [Yersinia ruckeri]